MTSKETVLQKYPLAETYKRRSNGVWELWESYGSRRVLMDGDTEESVWKKMADTIEYWKVDRREEIMNNLIKQLTGHGNNR